MGRIRPGTGGAGPDDGDRDGGASDDVHPYELDPDGYPWWLALWLPLVYLGTALYGLGVWLTGRRRAGR